MVYLSLANKIRSTYRFYKILIVIIFVGIMWLLLFSTGIVVHKYSFYKPFKELLSNKGMFGTSYIVQHQNNNELWFVNNSEELVEYLEHVENVYGMYQLEPKLVNNKLSAAWSYDDYFIQNYEPNMKEGVWLNNHKSKGDYLEAVVYTKRDLIKTGDVLKMTDDKTGLEFDVKIIGIISDDALLIGDAMDGTISSVQGLYVEPTVLIEGGIYGLEIKWNTLQPEKTYIPDLFIFRNDDLNKIDMFNNSYILDSKFIVRVMSGVCDIVYKNNITNEEIESINEKLTISDFLSKCSNDEKKEASLAYMYDELKLLLPMGICVLVLMIIALLSFVVLNFTLQLKTYAILTINGMKWKGSIIICLFQTVLIHISSLIAFAVSYLIINLLGIERLKYSSVSKLFIILTIGIILVDIVISLIMPIVIINKTTPKKVLYNN